MARIRMLQAGRPLACLLALEGGTMLDGLWQGVGAVACPDCGTWLVGLRHGREGYRCPDCGLGLHQEGGRFLLEREGQGVGHLAEEALERSVRWRVAPWSGAIALR